MRRRLVEELEPTGDASTPGALKTLYHSNYDGMLALGRFPVTLLPGRDVIRGHRARGPGRPPRDVTIVTPPRSTMSASIPAITRRYPSSSGSTKAS